MTDKSDERKALEELVACDDEDVWDEYTTGPANRKRAEQAWANARAVLATAPAEPAVTLAELTLLRESFESLKRIQASNDKLSRQLSAHRCGEVAALIERLRNDANRMLDKRDDRYTAGLEREAADALARLSAPVPRPSKELRGPPTIRAVLHILRNPDDWKEDSVRSARLTACSLLEAHYDPAAPVPRDVIEQRAKVESLVGLSRLPELQKAWCDFTDMLDAAAAPVPAREDAHFDNFGEHKPPPAADK